MITHNKAGQAAAAGAIRCKLLGPRRMATAFSLALMMLTLAACGGGGGDADQRPELPEPVSSGPRDVIAAPEESSSSLFLLQRSTSDSASGYAASESSQFLLTREELPQ